MTYTIDYETLGIGPRPHEYPPKPVGVGIKHNDQPGVYLSWGHPEENNCTEEEAVQRLREIWASGEPLLFQNGRFDLEVAEAHHGLPYPDWERVHDTQFLLYLYDPHARQLGLKPSSERILDWPAEEQDRLRAWVLGHVAEATGKTWGAYICRAPGDLVGEYCIGDVDRTWALFEYLYPYILENGMEEAYNRERELAPILVQMEQHGIRLDMPKLEADLEVYEASFDTISNQLMDKLGDINFNSGQQLAHALIDRGYVEEASLPRTPTGKLSTSQEALQSAVDNPTLLPMLAYRGALKTCLSTFMRPWTAMCG